MVSITVYGVAGRTRVIVTKDGYQTAVKQQTITSHETVDFDMALSRPREDVSGRYTLTFTASGGRTHSRFGGILEALRARFDLTSTGFNYYQYFNAFPDIFEELPGPSFLGIEGFSDASITGNTISGTFSGSIGVFSGPPYRSLARCTSINHRLSHVLYDDGTFALQNLRSQGSSEYRGTYTESNALITFQWQANQNVPAPWRPASGTLTDDSLTVRYDVIMNMDDFEDAVYSRPRPQPP
jgi:hypothetical protein